MAFHRNLTASTAVYDGAGSTSFTDLDLTSLVPEDCVAHLRVESNSTSGVNLVVFRPNGNTTITRGDDSMGCHCADVGDTVGSCADALCATTDGIVEWSAKQNYNLKIYLEGYYDCTLVDPLASGTPTINGSSVSTSWANLDLSSAVGSERRLVLFQVSGSASNKIAFRASDDTADMLLRCVGGADTSESVPQINGVNTSVASCALVPTGATGQVGAASYSTATTTTIYVHAYISDYTHYNSLLGSKSLTTSWANVDATSIVGTTDGVAILKVGKSSLSTTNHRFAFREDETSDDVDMTSGGAGCNRLTLSGYDQHIPSIGSLSPANGATDQPTDVPVSGSFTDAGSDINTSSFYLTINGSVAYDGGWQSGYGGSLNTSGFSCSTHPYLPNSTPIACHAEISDSQGDTGTASWSFTTTGAS